MLAACSPERAPETAGPQVVVCPAPAHFVSGQGCVADVKCPASAHFVEGTGCVGDVTPPTAAPVAPAGHGKAILVLVTPGAKVELVSGADRRVVSQFPIKIEIANDKEWTIEATKPGFRPYRQPIRFEDNVTEKTFNIELTK